MIEWVVIHLELALPLTQKCHYLQVVVAITPLAVIFKLGVGRMNLYLLNLHHLMVLTITAIIIVVTVVAIISVINVML